MTKSTLCINIESQRNDFLENLTSQINSGKFSEVKFFNMTSNIESSIKICEIIAESFYITEVSMSANNLGGNANCITVVRTLTASRVLNGIDLVNNYLTGEKAYAVMQVLALSPSIKSVNIAFNSLQEYGIKIAHIVASSSITHIDISYTNIKEHVTTVAAILATSPVLQYLNIGANKLGEDVIGVMKELKISPTLIHLNIGANELNRYALETVKFCFAFTNINRLDMIKNGLSDSEQEEITKYIEELKHSFKSEELYKAFHEVMEIYPPMDVCTLIAEYIDFEVTL